MTTLRRLAGTLSTAALAAALLTVSSPAVNATTMSCPSGFDLASVAELVSAGYVVAGVVDDPSSGVETFGRPGNGNGQLCIRAMGNKTTHFGGQYYLFADDGLRAG